MPRLTVVALELPLAFGKVAEGLAAVEAFLHTRPWEIGFPEEEPRAPVLVTLPEASLTGYVSPRGEFDLRPFAEPLDGPTNHALARLAARHRVALAGPLIEQAGEKVFNSYLLYGDSGERLGHWRKRHPWIPETWATPGDLGTPIVEWEGCKLTAGVCYDLHFLPEDAPDALASADVLLFPSAWVEEEDSRLPRLRALARRFHVAVVNPNWGRGSPRVPSQGGSLLLDAQGVLLAKAPAQLPPVWCAAQLEF